jgi:transposase
MTPLELDSRQRVALEYLVSRTPLAKERCRAQALLWLDEGEAVALIAEALHVSRQSVYNWVHRFRKRPELDLRERLADAPHPGRPRAGAGGIDPWIAEIIDTDPRDLGYRSTVWTAPLLRQYLQDRHDVRVSRKTVSRAIARLGLRWKRPRYDLALRPETWRQAKGGSNAG